MAPTNANATGVWTAQSKNNAKQGRQLLQAFFGNNDATPMNGTRSGVLVTTGITVASDLLVYNVVGLSMNVAPGWGIAHRSGQGPYAGELDSVVTVTCDTAPASNPRNDLIIMRMYDATLDTPPGGVPCRIEIITGTPNASPTDPMTPNALGVYTGFTDGAGGVGIPLARARVATTGAITLTDIRRSTAVAGAVRFLLPGDNPATAPVRAGEMQFNQATDTLQVSDHLGNWNTIPTGTAGRGYVNSFKGNTDLNVNTGTEQVLFSCSFTAVSGRRYKFTTDFEYYQKSGTAPYAVNMKLHTRIIAGATPTGTAGTILRGKYPNCPRDALFLTEPATMIGDDWVAPSSGTFTVSLSGSVDAGQGGIAGSGANTDHTYGILIEDIGV